MADETVNTPETEVSEATETKASAENTEKSEKEAKASKSTDKKKRSSEKKVGKFFRDTKGEFKKIIWPTFPSVVRNTGVTLAMCAVMGILICVVDLGLSALINLMV